MPNIIQTTAMKKTIYGKLDLMNQNVAKDFTKSFVLQLSDIKHLRAL
jgi:hypothetical protein